MNSYGWLGGLSAAGRRRRDGRGPLGWVMAACRSVVGRALVEALVVGAVVVGASFLGSNGLAQSQEAGEWIVVVGEGPLKVREEVVGKLYPGSILKITQTNGKWLALQGQRGWLDKNYVRGIEEAIELYQQQTAANPQDLAAFSILGSLY